MAESEIDEIIRLIRATMEDIYQRGRADERRHFREILFQEVASVQVQTDAPEHKVISANPHPHGEVRKRAPRGLPQALTTRVLMANSNGVTAQDIVEAAKTDHERMIAVSSIRGELRKGLEDGRYEERRGLWHLVPR
jgi:galactose-1-phosphate uridylyltransferase